MESLHCHRRALFLVVEAHGGCEPRRLRAHHTFERARDEPVGRRSPGLDLGRHVGEMGAHAVVVVIVVCGGVDLGAGKRDVRHVAGGVEPGDGRVVARPHAPCGGCRLVAHAGKHRAGEPVVEIESAFAVGAQIAVGGVGHEAVGVVDRGHRRRPRHFGIDGAQGFVVAVDVGIFLDEVVHIAVADVIAAVAELCRSHGLEHERHVAPQVI